MRWPHYKHVFFDCDSTLTTVEGIDILAETAGKKWRVEVLTKAAMDGQLDLEDVYGKRLQAVSATRAQIRNIRRIYKQNIVEDAREVIAALQALEHNVYIISGGLAEPVAEFGIFLGVPRTQIRAVQVDYNQLEGDWWQRITEDQEAGSARYLTFIEGDLTATNGKANVVKELLGEQSGRSLLIGDGNSDLRAGSAVDLFVGFGGVVSRPHVLEQAPAFIHTSSLAPLLVLAAGPAAYRLVKNTPHEAVFARGIDMIQSGALTFTNGRLQNKFHSALAKSNTTMMRILITGTIEQSGLDYLAQTDNVQFDIETNLSKDKLIALLPQYDAIIVRSSTYVDADIIAAGTKLKVIGRAGIGVDNIDIRTATMNGIIVTNTPKANSIARAEYAIGLMLAVSRYIPQSHVSLKNGNWMRQPFTGVQLHRKVLGLIGFGYTARLLAKRAQAFGMDVIAYAPVVSEEIGREYSVTLVDLDDLLAQSDFISLHTALLPETKQIINASTIAQMKDGVFLINTARGMLIDETALADALRQGKVRGAGLDVYAQEPPQNNPLIGLPNVIHTPHLGDYTDKAQYNVSTQIVKQVVDALQEIDFRNAVNLPYPPGADFAQIRPYMALGVKLGRLQAYLAAGSITQINIDVHSEAEDDLIRPIAAGILKGVLEKITNQEVNFINAPLLAEEKGIAVSRVKGISQVDYPNLILCQVHWQGGKRLLGGVLFAGGAPRIVQIDEYQLEAKPEGCVIVMLNKDVPGVIGQVGTLLAAYEVNIGEWRMGRQQPGGVALSFINVDVEPPTAVIDALARITAVTDVKLVSL